MYAQGSDCAEAVDMMPTARRRARCRVEGMFESVCGRVAMSSRIYFVTVECVDVDGKVGVMVKQSGRRKEEVETYLKYDLPRDCHGRATNS